MTNKQFERRMEFINEQRKKFRAGMKELRKLQAKSDLGHRRLSRALREVEAKMRNLETAKQ